MTRRCSITIVTFILVVCISIPTLAEAGAGQPLPWLNWSGGAKAIGLGRSQTAIENKAGAVFINPADLVWQDGKYVTLMHTQPFAGVSYDLAGVTYPLSSLTFGLGYQRLYVDGINEYDGNGNLTGIFTDHEQAVSLAAGATMSENLSLGAALRITRQRLNQETAFGYGLDLGWKWQPISGLKVAFVATNPVSSVRWSTGVEEKLASTYRLGASYTWEKYDLMLTGEYLQDLGDEPFHFGIEKGYQKNLRFRAGLDGTTPTLGMGFVMDRLEVDYALILDFDLGKRQYLSLNWRY